MAEDKIIVMAVGDCILYHPQPEELFAYTAETLRSADITFGQNELPMTNRPAATCPGSSFIRTPDSSCTDPETAAEAYKQAGFDILSNAGNHVWDGGIPGIEDTLEALKKTGVESVGMGMNSEEARKPVILERKGVKVGFLSYNLTGPEETWANSVKPGCAYIRVIGEYIPEEPCKGGSARPYTACAFEDLEKMRLDIENARGQCDVLIVNFHQGVGLVRATVADYERMAARAAIEQGADLVMGEHAHIVKGMEMYKGKAIVYGMGNFACSFKRRLLLGKRDLSKEEMEVAERTHDVTGQWRDLPDDLCRLFDYKKGDKPLSNFPPECLITFILKVEISDKKISKVGFLPCLINGDDQPVIYNHTEKGETIAKYIEDISFEAGLNKVEFNWEGDEVILQ